MNTNILNKLKALGAVMDIRHLNTPQILGLAVTNDNKDTEYSICCNQTVQMTFKLKIRHGKRLILRNLLWYVTKGQINIPLLGNQVLRAIGLEPEEILKSAFEKFGDDIDLNNLSNKMFLKGRLDTSRTKTQQG